jgi:L-threonylcarbamoyladenylate synthase
MEPDTLMRVALDEDNVDGWLPRAVDCLEAGGTVALPTETFYGLAVDAADEAAVERLHRLKGHRERRAILVLAGCTSQVERLGDPAVLAPLEPLLSEFWPGPLTVVLPLRSGASLAACPAGTMAVRVPGHAVPRSLAEALGRPITGTSANPAGQPPAGVADEVSRYFAGGVDLLLDAGTCRAPQPSTLVDFTCEPPLLLRSGTVPAELLEAALGRPLQRDHGR